MPNREATLSSATYFEQIPLEAVQKIAAREEAPAPRAGDGHFHGVQFYNDPDALCRIVGTFIGEGLEEGALGVLIATPEHAAQIESCLRGRGIDVDEWKRLGQLVSVDARETLQLVMDDGMPDPSAFQRAVGGILTKVRRGREQCAVRTYGEMVDLLWKDGREAAAIRLETLWNQLASVHDFELLCGYSMGNFYKGGAMDEIKGHHTHSLDVDGFASALRTGGRP